MKKSLRGRLFRYISLQGGLISWCSDDMVHFVCEVMKSLFELKMFSDLWMPLWLKWPSYVVKKCESFECASYRAHVTLQLKVMIYISCFFRSHPFSVHFHWRYVGCSFIGNSIVLSHRSKHFLLDSFIQSVFVLCPKVSLSFVQKCLCANVLNLTPTPLKLTRSPNTPRQVIAQSPEPIYSHEKDYLSKQPPWGAAIDPRLARSRSRVWAPAPWARCACIFFLHPLLSSFGK